MKNEKLAFGRDTKIILYYTSEIPPPLGGRLGGGQKKLRIKNEELRICLRQNLEIKILIQKLIYYNKKIILNY